MTADTLSVLTILALGLFAGTALGLLTGWLTGAQKNAPAAMSRRDLAITISLVLACSAIITAALAYYAFVMVP